MEDIREHAPANETPLDWAALAELREQIDRVDESLVAAVAARFRLAEEVGTLKGASGIPVLDPAREAEIVRRASQTARAEDVPVEGMRQLFWVVLDYCREGVRDRHRIEQTQTHDRVAFGG